MNKKATSIKRPVVCYKNGFRIDERSHFPGSGIFSNGVPEGTLNNKAHSICSDFIRLEENPKMPTRERSVIEFAQNIFNYEKADATVIYLPGYSETAAQVGDLLWCFFEQLYAAGYESPHYIGLNPCGRATEGYMQNLNKVSKITLDDQLEDVKNIVKKVLETGRVQGDIFLVGHSIGWLNSLAALEVILEQRKDCNIALVGEMPATDKPLATATDKRFIGSTFHLVPQAIRKIKNGSALDVEEEDHSKLMSNGQLDKRLFDRRCPDSARVFFNYATLMRRKFDHVFDAFRSANGKAFIFAADQEGLLPPDMAFDEYLRLRNYFGIESRYEQGAAFPHAIPYFMNEAQWEQQSRFLGNVSKAFRD